MASWIRSSARTAVGNFDEEEQIESPAMREPDPRFLGMDDQEVVEQIWLDYFRAGADPRALAKQLKVSKDTIYRAIKRAQLREKSRLVPQDPRVEPLFPINPYTPDSPCVHPVPFPEGAREYCPGCHQTGVEGHPALRVRPGDTDAPLRRHMPNDGLDGGTDKKRRGPKPKSAAARKLRRAQTTAA